MYNPRKVRAGDEITAPLWNELQDEIRRLGNISVAGMTLRNVLGGVSFGVKLPDASPVTAVVSEEIAARVGPTELGEGKVVLWPRTPGTPDLTEGGEVTVWNCFNVAIPVDTFVKVLPDGAGDYELMSSDCF